MSDIIHPSWEQAAKVGPYTSIYDAVKLADIATSYNSHTEAAAILVLWAMNEYPAYTALTMSTAKHLKNRHAMHLEIGHAPDGINEDRSEAIGMVRRIVSAWCPSNDDTASMTADDILTVIDGTW